MTESSLAAGKARRRAAAKTVAVVGFGNIGTGVVELLYQKGIAGLKLAKVVDVDLERKRRIALPPGFLSRDWHEVVNDPKIDIVVELIGGIEPAKSIQVAALQNGKDVVTANKKLLAREGEQIFQFAASLNRRIGFRASFVGAHWLIHEFRQAGTAAKKFRRIYAILNGTSNYILSAMTRDGRSFEEALTEAQAKGYAEADPGQCNILPDRDYGVQPVPGDETAQFASMVAHIYHCHCQMAPVPNSGSSGTSCPPGIAEASGDRRKD